MTVSNLKTTEHQRFLCNEKQVTQTCHFVTLRSKPPSPNPSGVAEAASGAAFLVDLSLLVPSSLLLVDSPNRAEDSHCTLSLLPWLKKR